MFLMCIHCNVFACEFENKIYHVSVFLNYHSLKSFGQDRSPEMHSMISERFLPARLFTVG